MVTKILPVPHISQDQTQWCWAANVDMVADFFGNPKLKQCQIAGEQFDTDDCDQPGELAADGTTSNQGVNPEDIENIWARNDVASTFRPNFVTFEVLKSEIDQGRPVQVGWLWETEGGHVVIIRGYKEDANEQTLFINDPLEEYLDEDEDENETVAIKYSDLLIADNQGGTWAFTWTDLKSVPGLGLLNPHTTRNQLTFALLPSRFKSRRRSRWHMAQKKMNQLTKRKHLTP